MASEAAIVKMMRVFSRNFAGEVTKEKCHLYHAALQDVGDEELEVAAVRVIKEHRGEFIPPVAVIRDACGANATSGAIDVEAILRAISSLGEYHVDAGRWRYPMVAEIAAALGPAIAEAFGEVGGAPLLFANSDITREIAMRDFARALSRVAKHRGASAVALPAPMAGPKQIVAASAAATEEQECDIPL